MARATSAGGRPPTRDTPGGHFPGDRVGPWHCRLVGMGRSTRDVGLVPAAAHRAEAASRWIASGEVVSAVNGSLVSVLEARVLVCVECGDERPFEQPPCVDDHEQCAEWACVECGFAVFLDPGFGDREEAADPVAAMLVASPAAPAAPGPDETFDRRPHAA